jgi:hypothetical protein
MIPKSGYRFSDKIMLKTALYLGTTPADCQPRRDARVATQTCWTEPWGKNPVGCDCRLLFGGEAGYCVGRDDPTTKIEPG